MIYTGSAKCNKKDWEWSWGSTDSCDCHKGWEGLEGNKRSLLQEKQWEFGTFCGQGSFWWRLQEVSSHSPGKLREDR